MIRTRLQLATFAGIFGMFGLKEQRRTMSRVSHVADEVPDHNRPARVAKIKAQAEMRRRRRNSDRLLAWTGARSAGA